MADRRMFSTNVIDSDAFLDMPHSARLLYYDFGMRADDDGFVDSPKKVMRIIGAQESDLEELISNGFIHRFDSGVVVILHWNVNNKVRKDLYRATIYSEEKSMLSLEKNNVYRVRNESVTKSLRASSESVTQEGRKEGREYEDKVRLGSKVREGSACVREESPESPADSSATPSPDEVFIYFPTSRGNVPIYFRDVENLERQYNGAVDVKSEMVACAANAREKPNAASTWQYAVACWIARTIRYKTEDKVAAEDRKSAGKRSRSMEKDKYIETEDAGL